MSKWKDKTISIKSAYAVFSDRSQSTYQFGLGSDGKLYQWDFKAGAWLKHWKQEDKPEES